MFYGRGVDMWGEFKTLKEKYEDILKRYNDNTIKTENEIEDIYKEVLNEIKKVNLLKLTGLKIHINKYFKNMKYLEVELNESISLKEESIERAELINTEYPDFLSFLGFSSKNPIQKMLYMTFRVKKVEDEVINFEKEIDDIIYRRELLVIYNRLVRDEVRELRKSIEDLLKYIDKIEGQFTVYKKDILLSKEADGSFSKKKLSWECGMVFYRYNEFIEILMEVIKNKYSSLENEISKGKEIISRIDNLITRFNRKEYCIT
ncbi:Uncharacterised protein [uncultured Clostridium sp.]|uniref:hypothetical protein n=1 Tax=uncultured Clostridium sp. TaxID=59620 RepID=UPI000820C597|nr:hypothetical protein [uncultured Clostridium sp.]SCJ38044.1 Uncharacterised protein [uncultured Clostridium sp.]